MLENNVHSIPKAEEKQKTFNDVTTLNITYIYTINKKREPGQIKKLYILQQQLLQRHKTTNVNEKRKNN